MKTLKFEFFKNRTKCATINIPILALRFASHFIPEKYLRSFHQNSMSFDEIINIAINADSPGTIVEVDNHKDDERIIVSIE